MEIAPRLGQADVVCDLVSSGATLAANQLKPVLDIMQSEAVLAGPAQPFGDVRAELADLLLRRMDGVLRIRDSKLLIFQAPRDAVDQLLQLLPDAVSHKLADHRKPVRFHPLLHRVADV